MITKELSESAVEINCIFDNMTTETLQQIPKNFRNFFKKNIVKNLLISI